MKIFQALILALLLTSCGVSVNYDYEKGTDFTQYKTYNYFDNMETGLSELDSKRFFEVLDTSLQSKGFVLSETPDFIIDVKSRTFQTPQSSSVGMGVGSGGGGVSVGIPIGQNSVSRRIILDFVDANNQQLFWQGVSSEPSAPANSPEARSAQFQKVVLKLLEKYPPKK
ncbi:DUF4136 domain-containing protein [Bizionia myxarmorum]|uniref:DUF4136 domain-containing protein n=1 Tax=Bizionia myxarmorum TaxID=291186 RepID=A0A5D0RCU4_9FLAO|nr:DUF4136 domain-containing protein [Bizionia myxarmorum]TYB79322.1 DUF4136 domain-containing protein [Bizionia myxarmorum]